MSDTTLPTVMGASGLQPTPPSTILTNLLAAVAATNPGYTANLPGSLVEDISSTDVGAIVLCDQSRVELVNSITPYGANAFLLNQLGQIYGVPAGQTTNTSVYVVFSGTVDFSIQRGFVVSDGTYQYVVQSGGIIESGGSSTSLLAVATQTGAWAVPASSVTQLVTSVPTGITLSVTNPQAGTPAAASETEDDYRARVLQAGLAASIGTPAFLKTLLQNIPGVLTRLVSVRYVAGSGWEVICGGNGDPNAIANAIYQSVDNLALLTGSVMAISGITQANPGVVSTVLNHGYSTGQVVTFSGVGGMTELNSDTVSGTTITAPGTGYTSAPTVTFGAPPSGVTATGTATISGGAVIGITITNGGSGYTITPPVTLSGGGGSGASATATLGPLNFTATVIDEKTFSIGVNTSGYTAYTSDGQVLPNLRNVTATIYSYPDSYPITFVNPPQQTVTVNMLWNTISTNFVSVATFNQLAQQAIISYINALPVGAPINLFALEDAVQMAVATVLPLSLLTRMVFTIDINNVAVPPVSGTGVIEGDPESYMYASAATVTVSQG